MGLEGAGGQKGPKGRPGGPQLYCYLLHFGHFGVSGTLLGRFGGVCGLSGRLRGAPGGTLETFWDLLGSSGSTFWDHFFWVKSSSLQFQIEKCTRSVFELDEVYNSCCFKPDLRKNPVAKPSKELVCFFCRSARFAVLQLLFSGSAEVAAGLSNPPTPVSAWR